MKKFTRLRLEHLEDRRIPAQLFFVPTQGTELGIAANLRNADGSQATSGPGVADQICFDENSGSAATITNTSVACQSITDFGWNGSIVLQNGGNLFLHGNNPGPDTFIRTMKIGTANDGTSNKVDFIGGHPIYGSGNLNAQLGCGILNVWVDGGAQLNLGNNLTLNGADIIVGEDSVFNRPSPGKVVVGTPNVQSTIDTMPGDSFDIEPQGTLEVLPSTTLTHILIGSTGEVILDNQAHIAPNNGSDLNIWGGFLTVADNSQGFVDGGLFVSHAVLRLGVAATAISFLNVSGTLTLNNSTFTASVNAGTYNSSGSCVANVVDLNGNNTFSCYSFGDPGPGGTPHHYTPLAAVKGGFFDTGGTMTGEFTAYTWQGPNPLWWMTSYPSDSQGEYFCLDGPLLD